jgi:hypothetical protein
VNPQDVDPAVRSVEVIMNTRTFRRGMAALLVATGVAAGASPALACSLDNKPSVSANGLLAEFNPQVPINSSQLANFAPFVFSRSYPLQKPVTLTENRRDIARSLQPSAMQHPWRWRFGDGKVAYGWTVKHAFSRKGNLRISVDAYYPGTKQWYLFDQVLIRVA